MFPLPHYSLFHLELLLNALSLLASPLLQQPLFHLALPLTQLPQSDLLYAFQPGDLCALLSQLRTDLPHTHFKVVHQLCLEGCLFLFENTPIMLMRLFFTFCSEFICHLTNSLVEIALEFGLKFKSAFLYLKLQLPLMLSESPLVAFLKLKKDLVFYPASQLLL